MVAEGGEGVVRLAGEQYHSLLSRKPFGTHLFFNVLKRGR